MAAAPEEVIIVSKKRATLRDLEAYLASAGCASHARTELVTAARGLPEAARALVLFPDDFAAPRVQAFLQQLRRSRPRLLVVVVTRDATRLGGGLEAGGRALPPLVLPLPPFGWEILEAIRSRGRGRGKMR